MIPSQEEIEEVVRTDSRLQGLPILRMSECVRVTVGVENGPLAGYGFHVTIVKMPNGQIGIWDLVDWVS